MWSTAQLVICQIYLVARKGNITLLLFLLKGMELSNKTGH